MSADQVSSVSKPDAPVPAAGQGGDAVITGGASRQHDAAGHQPVKMPSRHEHADAMLAGPPVRSRETPGDSATPDHQAGKAGRAWPEHSTGPVHEERAPARPQTPVRTRQDHADAMLAGALASPVTKRDLDRPGDQPNRPPGQAAPGRPAGPGSEQAGTRGDHQASSDGRAGTRQQDPGEAGSPDRTLVGPAPSPGTDQVPGATRHPAPDAGAGRNRGTSDDGQAPGGTTAGPDGRSTTARDGTPGHHADAAAAGRHRVHEGRQHGHQQAVARHDSGQPPARQDHGDAWPPPKADQDRARVLYAEDFGAQATTRNANGGWERGTNVVGDKPDKSPGDTSDLPPTGQELVEMEDEDDSYLDKFQKEFYKEADDAIDSGNSLAETVQDFMDRPPPAGHPEIAVNAGPAIGPEVPQHATVDAGSAAEMTIVLAVVGCRAIGWAHHKIDTLLRR
jgi:hypothetical protein